MDYDDGYYVNMSCDGRYYVLMPCDVGCYVVAFCDCVSILSHFVLLLCQDVMSGYI